MPETRTSHSEEDQPRQPRLHSRIWSRLTEPHASIAQPEDKGRARLLSVLLIVTLFVGGLSTVITWITDNDHPVSIRNQLLFVNMVAVFVLLAVYILSRTRYTLVAAFLFILVVTFSTFAAFGQNPGDGTLLFYPVLGGLLSGLFLSPRSTGYIFGFILIGILLVPLMVPGNQPIDILHPFFFILTVAALVIMASLVRHREEEQIRVQSRVLVDRDEKMRAAILSAEVANQQLKKWVTEVEQQSSEISLLSQMGEMLQSCVNLQEANEVVSEFSNLLFPRLTGAFYALNSSKNLLEGALAWGEEKQELEKQLFSPEECWALRRGRIYSPDSIRQGLVCNHVTMSGQSPPDYACIPLLAQGDVLGVYFVSAARSGLALTDSQKKLAQSVADQFSLAIANLKLHELLRLQSIRDPLTGLFNRRYLEETFERELQRSIRNQTPIGIVMCDIDHFKKFNDTYGHEAGDMLLQSLGRFLLDHLRGSDIACRFGGEEFTLILPESSLEATQLRADLMRQEIHGTSVNFRGQTLGSISLSFGVASFPNHGVSREDLMRVADRALYKAKKEGRNMVVVG